MGISESATVEMMETLQKAKHRVCTAFGTSSKLYGGTRFTLFQRIGQGNGAGPTIWALISALLLNIIALQGFGLNLTCISSCIAIAMVGFAFVDDTNLIHLAQAPPPTYQSNSTLGHEMIKKGQEMGTM